MSILLALASAPAGIVLSGALVAGPASVDGSLVSESVINGALSAQASTVSGSVTVSSPLTVTMSGALNAQAAAVDGTLVGFSKLTGTLNAQASTITGSLKGKSTVTGTLVAQAAQSSGALTTKWMLFSPDVYLLEGGTDKYLLEDASGFYRREEIALTAQASAISGALEITGGELGTRLPYHRGLRERIKRGVPDRVAEAIEQVLVEYQEPEPPTLVEAAALLVEAGVRARKQYVAVLVRELAERERVRIAQEQEDDDAAQVAISLLLH